MTTLRYLQEIDESASELLEAIDTPEDIDWRRLGAAQKIAELNPLTTETKEEELAQWDELVEYSRSDEPEIAEPARAKLFEAITPTIERAVRRTLHTADRTRTEDFHQETMHKIFEKGILSGKYNGGNFPGWVNRVATNSVLSSFRGRQYKNDLLVSQSLDSPYHSGEPAKDKLQASDNVEDEALAIKPEEFMKLLEASGISSRFRDILYLRAFEEKNYNEIAAELNISKGSVCSGLSRARKQIRDALKSNPELSDSL